MTNDAASNSSASLTVRHEAPAAFEPHSFALDFFVTAPIEAVWEWLCRTETFTDGQPQRG